MRRPAGRRPSEPRVIGINISDLHLSLNAPASRADEDWLEAMRRPLRQISDLQKEHGCPVFCNGDVFDRWNAPAELINFALAELPFMSAVPGQHDLPYHRYEDIKRSSYWTLVEAGRIKNLIPGEPFHASDELTLWGWPWGIDVGPPRTHTFGGLNVAVIHSYIWTQGHSYPGAPEEKRLKAWIPKLDGYDVACYGDNHKGFSAKKGGLTVFNCGGMMRRKSDEKDYRPQFGVLMSDGSLVPTPFDISHDVLLPGKPKGETPDYSADLGQFIDSLRTLGESTVDFIEAVNQEIARTKINKGVRERILKAME